MKQYEGGKKVNNIEHEIQLLHFIVSIILKDKERTKEAMKGSGLILATMVTKQHEGPIANGKKKLQKFVNWR